MTSAGAASMPWAESGTSSAAGAAAILLLGLWFFSQGGFAATNANDGDQAVDFDGVEVIVDDMSVPYLDGATIDFKDTISEQGFTIDNPNAQGSCACGDSFQDRKSTRLNSSH